MDFVRKESEDKKEELKEAVKEEERHDAWTDQGSVASLTTDYSEDLDETAIDQMLQEDPVEEDPQPMLSSLLQDSDLDVLRACIDALRGHPVDLQHSAIRWIYSFREASTPSMQFALDAYLCDWVRVY